MSPLSFEPALSSPSLLAPPGYAAWREWPSADVVRVAAIDPAAEAKLVGLSRAMVGGSYLRSTTRPHTTKPASVKWLAIPTLAASESVLGEQLAFAAANAL